GPGRRSLRRSPRGRAAAPRRGTAAGPVGSAPGSGARILFGPEERAVTRQRPAEAFLRIHADEDTEIPRVAQSRREQQEAVEAEDSVLGGKPTAFVDGCVGAA